MTRAADLTYEEYRERLDTWITKNARRKVVKARRVERQRIKRAGGGKAIAALMMKPARKAQ